MDDRDDLVKAQQQIIGILFEIIKLQQANSDLDSEYFKIVTGSDVMQSRLDEIIKMKQSNSETIARLLEQLET